MTGRVALLTGAGRGIGLAIAKGFVAAGCAVAIQDIDLAVARAAVAEIERSGGRAIALDGDAADLSLPPRCVAATVEQLGGLHVLVNNAAIQQRADWMEQDPAEMVHTLSTNIVGPILFCRAAMPVFKAQRWGRIINIGSIQGRRGNIHMLPYSLSKAALDTFTHALAREVGQSGVTVNTIAPGWIAGTHRNRGDFPTAQDKHDKGRHITVGRVGEPEDLAGIALTLCTAAGDYVTGQTIFIDGGMSA